MVERLSDTDWQRIQEFADTPDYERTPEQLLPEADEFRDADEDEA